MNIKGLNNTTASAYLQYLTGNKNASANFTSQTQSSGSTTSTSTAISTPDLDKAMEGKANLTLTEQAAARKELKALILSRLFNVNIEV